jgi:N-acetylneuraminic acid mutarotase
MLESDDLINCWREQACKGKLFSPRTGHTAIIVKEMVYLFGGSDTENILNDFYQYDIKTNIWNQISPKGSVPAMRSGSKSVVLDDTIYFFGGYTF